MGRVTGSHLGIRIQQVRLNFLLYKAKVSKLDINKPVTGGSGTLVAGIAVKVIVASTGVLPPQQLPDQIEKSRACRQLGSFPEKAGVIDNRLS